MIISLSDLAAMGKIQKNVETKVRLGSPINIPVNTNLGITKYASIHILTINVTKIWFYQMS